jgi:hypothetical protein
MENDDYNSLIEIGKIIDTISELKDKTLDHFYEDKDLASQLMVDLSNLQEEAKNLSEEFERLINFNN